MYYTSAVERLSLALLNNLFLHLLLGLQLILYQKLLLLLLLFQITRLLRLRSNFEVVDPPAGPSTTMKYLFFRRVSILSTLYSLHPVHVYFDYLLRKDTTL